MATQIRNTIAGSLALALLLAGGAHAQGKGTPAKGATDKKIYCWDEGGRKICGDALPAEAANRARSEFSARTGMRTRELGRALTAEEAAAAATAQAEVRKLADAKELALRKDMAMVESYGTEAELRRAYGERTALLDETLKASQLGISNLRLSLINLLRQAGDKELAEEVVPKRLLDGIRGQHTELLRQQQIALEQERDRAELEAEMQDSLRRYRELKQPEGAEAAPAEAAPEAVKPA